MKSIFVTDNNNLRGILISCENDHKTARRAYKRLEEIFYNNSLSFYIEDSSDEHKEDFESSMFDENVSEFSVSVNVRNKTNTSLLIEDAELFVYDRRLNLQNYRYLDGIDKVPSIRANPDTMEIGYDPITAKVKDNRKHSIKTEYKKEEGITTGIYLECQTSSYFELMPVLESRIVGVIGLPPGMVFEYGKIKGSPSKSGEYKGLITLVDGRVINLVIKVARIRRMF